MAFLRPGEAPGDAPQVRQRLGAETPSRAGPDVQQGDFLEGARRLKVADQAGMLDQPTIRGVRRPRQRFHRLVEFGSGNQRLLPLGLERVLEYAGREQLGLVRGGAAVRVLERHDLALLRHAESPLYRTGGPPRGRAGGGVAATAGRAPGSV